MITIDRALADPNLLGAALGNLKPWATWVAILKAAFALPLSEEEAAIFHVVAGGRTPPSKPVAELWVIAGRRGGKSRMAAAVSAFAAAFIAPSVKLAPGETGHVLALAPSKLQAQTVRDYVQGFFEASPVLAQMVRSTTAEEIRLDGDISVSVHAANFRTVRGRSVLAAVLDESAFFRDETSASPDVEIYRAILPALATTAGMLIAISSPYRKVGLLHQKHKESFGLEDEDVLVIQASSLQLNPVLNAGVIDRARRTDPEAARSEWDAEFRSDLTALFDEATIDAAVETGRPLELPPREGLNYLAFVDASAGRHDAFTLCIGHSEGEVFVADVVRGRKAPFDPNSVAEEFSALIKDYKIARVIGDNFAGEWVSQAFKSNGVAYERADRPKSALYLESVPYFMRGVVRIPNHPVLLKELRTLERRTSRSGRDSVDHPQNGADDHCNALAGCLVMLEARRARGTYNIEFLC